MIARASLPFLAVLLLGACASDKAAPDQGMMVREGQARSEVLADRFQKELLSALTTAMATEGPQGAIGVCSSIAPALAAQLGGKRCERQAHGAARPQSGSKGRRNRAARHGRLGERTAGRGRQASALDGA
ncbi:hypothetical protein [Novosphingobium panipatense]|uniref:hypothetical protein n=1 Tax=Novosphingobium panipatense TaxID=428991 RepID=UPI0036141E2A